MATLTECNAPCSRCRPSSSRGKSISPRTNHLTGNNRQPLISGTHNLVTQKAFTHKRRVHAASLTLVHAQPAGRVGLRIKSTSVPAALPGQTGGELMVVVVLPLLLIRHRNYLSCHGATIIVPPSPRKTYARYGQNYWRTNPAAVCFARALCRAVQPTPLERLVHVHAAPAAAVQAVWPRTRSALRISRTLFLPLAPPGEAIARRAQVLTRQRFGKVIRLFAPLYLSNECINNCSYCGFSRDNHPAVTLSLEDVITEGRALAEQGFRNVLLVAGEHPRLSVKATCRNA